MTYKSSDKKVKNYKEADIVFCSFSPVGLDDYVTYFINSFRKFIYLKWKFPHSNGVSELDVYENKSLVSRDALFSLPVFNSKILYFLFLPFNYLIYFFQSFRLLSKRTSNVCIFFGINYFCTFCGIFLKKLGIVDFVIYRVMDFFPLPPKGPYRILNRIFYVLDSFCLREADSIWFTTEGHIVGREKYRYFDRSKYDYQIIPLGIDVSKFISKPINKAYGHSLVYCGVISKYHLLDLLFDVVSDLKRDFNDIKLNLIGSGPDEGYFKDLSKKMKLDSNIIFHGFMEDGDKFRDLMSRNILGIAFYKDEENFMKYTEPAKVKYYLSFGVPAIISNVPKISEELDSKKVSFAVNNKKEDIVNVVKKFIIDKNMQEEYKNNIKEFVKQIDVNSLLNNSFSGTFGVSFDEKKK